MHVKRRVRTPGNKNVIHKVRSKVGSKLCANCKSPLHGIPRLTTSGLSKISWTKRTVKRAYGGYFCGSCGREALKEKAFNL